MLVVYLGSTLTFDIAHCTGVLHNILRYTEGWPSILACKSENADRQDWYVFV